MASDKPSKSDAQLRPKPSGKRKGRKLSQKEQSERFVETARMLGTTENRQAFEKAVSVIVPKRNP